VGKGFDSSWIAPSFRGALLVRLVLEGTIMVIVHLFMSFLLNALTLLAPVVNPDACISIADDIAQVSVIPIMPSATLLRWSETAGQVPPKTLSVDKLFTPCFTIMVEDRVNHSCLEALYMCVDFFIVFRQVGCELVGEHSRGEGIVSQRAVNQFSLVLDPTDFLSYR
jgi:hypothetical protein